MHDPDFIEKFGLLFEQEGLPRSILEAMSLGRAVIGTRIRGVTDLLETGSGLLVPLGDVVRLADAMRQVLELPDQTRAMGERGRVRIADFDQSKIIRMHEELYDEALGTTPGKPTADGRGSRLNGEIMTHTKSRLGATR